MYDVAVKQVTWQIQIRKKWFYFNQFLLKKKKTIIKTTNFNPNLNSSSSQFCISNPEKLQWVFCFCFEENKKKQQ